MASASRPFGAKSTSWPNWASIALMVLTTGATSSTTRTRFGEGEFGGFVSVMARHGVRGSWIIVRHKGLVRDRRPDISVVGRPLRQFQRFRRQILVRDPL